VSYRGSLLCIQGGKGFSNPLTFLDFGHDDTDAGEIYFEDRLILYPRGSSRRHSPRRPFDLTVANRHSCPGRRLSTSNGAVVGRFKGWNPLDVLGIAGGYIFPVFNRLSLRVG
jgi:hypothetical protein